MAKARKPNLKQALKKIDQAYPTRFGNVDVDLSSLPCLKKAEKEKITANFDVDVLEAIREIAQEHEIPYTTLMNDVLRQVFIDHKKVG